MLSSKAGWVQSLAPANRKLHSETLSHPNTPKRFTETGPPCPGQPWTCSSYQTLSVWDYRLYNYCTYIYSGKWISVGTLKENTFSLNLDMLSRYFVKSLWNCICLVFILCCHHRYKFCLNKIHLKFSARSRMPLWVISPDLCITLSTYMLEVFVIFFLKN